MTRAGEFSIPRNRIGRHLRTFNERSDHVGFGNQWIDDKSGVMRIHGPDETPIAGPRVHLYFHKQAPTPLFDAPLSPPATPRPNWRIAPLFAFANAAKVVAFFGSSVEKIVPSRIWSFAESTFRAVEARSRRSFLSLSAALQVAAP